MNNSRLVISWGREIRRSTSLAEKIKGDDCHIPPFLFKKSLISKLINYAVSFISTLTLLFRRKPASVVVVLPPVFPLYAVFFYKLLTCSRLEVIADLHNGVLRKEWSAWPLLGFLLRKCGFVIAHNSLVKERIDRTFGVNAVVLGDPLANFLPERVDVRSGRLDSGGVNVLVPLSYAADEPVAEILEAACLLPDDIVLHLTGDFTRLPFSVESIRSRSLNFTGFLPRNDYVELLYGCDFVLCLSTDEEIQMCALIEAISAEKMFLCSTTEFNRSLIADERFLTRNDPESLSVAICRMAAQREVLASEVSRIRERYSLKNSEAIKEVFGV